MMRLFIIALVVLVGVVLCDAHHDSEGKTLDNVVK